MIRPDPVEYLVLGAGLAGSATAWQLAARGHDVVLVERAAPAAQDGSSHGSARILRYAYRDRLYTELVVEARRLWRELEDVTGLDLVTTTGAVDYGSTRGPRDLARVLRDSHIQHELLSAAEGRRRWPQIAFDTEVLWHPGAAVIDSQTSVVAMTNLAMHLGATIYPNWNVEVIEAEGAAYRVRSVGGEVIRANNVVICAGGWLPDLLGALPLPHEFVARLPKLDVRQEQVFHFPYRETEEFKASPWPTFVYDGARIETYGLPGGRDVDFRGHKVAEYNGGPSIGSATKQNRIVDPCNRRRVVEHVKQYLPGLVPEPYAETTCLFTNTPSENFIIDRVDNLTIVSACSGHGAKFAPLIGLMATRLATGTSTVPTAFQLGQH